MYVFAYDRATSTLVGAKVGEPCTDADYERIIETTNMLVENAPAKAIACLVMVIEPGQPPPSPVWRQRLALARSPTRPFRFAFVSASILERGAVTAIQWLRPPLPGQKAASCTTFEEAVAWIEAEGGPRPILRFLYANVRDQAARAAAGAPKSATGLRARAPVDDASREATPKDPSERSLQKAAVRS